MNDDIDMGYPVEPPPEQGVTLGEYLYHRHGRDRIRVSLETTHGPRTMRLVRIQGWRLGDDQQWWPRPSCTVRLDQVPELIACLDEAGLVATRLDDDAPRLARHDAEDLEGDPYHRPDQRRGEPR